MISKWINNSLTHEARKKLYQGKERFEYFTPSDGTFEQDGPTMLRIIFEHVSPTQELTYEQDMTEAVDEKVSEVKDQSARIKVEKSSATILPEVETIQDEGVTGKLDEKYDLTADYSYSLQEAANSNYWGPIVHEIPVNWNSDGAVTKTRSIINESDRVNIEHVIKNAERIWGGYRIVDESEFDEEILQMRMKSTMISKWINNSLTHEARKKLYQEKEWFEYFTPSDGTFEQDGPTMLRIIFELVSPTQELTYEQDMTEAVDEKVSEVKDQNARIEAETSSASIIAAV